jgi:hypothetical protein
MTLANVVLALALGWWVVIVILYALSERFDRAAGIAGIMQMIWFIIVPGVIVYLWLGWKIIIGVEWLWANLTGSH